MIDIIIYKTAQDGKIFGFKAKNHGKSVVCSAVSALTINTVNSIEKFADCEIVCDFKSEGGFLQMEIPDIKNGKGNESAELLLNSLMLGLTAIKSEYKDQIKLTEVQ
jgi:uncharacterized protein YsxB (DUF464 family)